MKHFRPIKTFATWLEEGVDIEVEPTKDDSWGGGDFDQWIEDQLGLEKAQHGDLRLNIYSHSYRGFPQKGEACTNYLRFPRTDQADEFQAKFGGRRLTVLRSQNSRRNEGIGGNFTIDDLVAMYGSPLPAVIQYHLVDMENRLSGYFDDFKYLHQPWARNWLPSGWAYVGDQNNEHHQEVSQWLYGQLYREGEEKYAWLKTWASSAEGVYEFDDPHLARLFRLRFAQPLPDREIRLRERPDKQKAIDALIPHVSGIRRTKDNWYIWERPANTPDYQSLLIGG